MGALPLIAAAPISQGHAVLDLLIVLAAAALVSMVLRRVRLAAIPGYLITGALIGPAALRLITDGQDIADISSLAILLLMFIVGLHLDVDSIQTGMVRIVLVGVVSTVAVVLALWPLAMLFGLSAPAALTAAMALSMSSTAVMLRLLQQRREARSMHGRVVFGTLIVQDLLVVIILAVLPPIARWSGVGLTGAVAQAQQSTPGPQALGMIAAAAVGLGGIAALIVLGRLLLPRLLLEASKEGSPEVLLVLSAALALGAAVLTSQLGFSAELGAFLAGFLLASTPFRHQISGQLAPMRDLLMAVFFTVVGLKMDLHAVAAHWWILALALPALLLLKAAVIALVTWAGGATAPVAALCGLALCQAGEFTLVILAVAADQSILDANTRAVLIALVVLSLILTPTLYGLAHRVRPFFARIPTASWIGASGLRRHEQPSGADDPAKPARHVIIAGFGIVGRNLAEHFAAADIPFTIVELNPATVRRQRRLGRSIVFGDITIPEVLHSAGIERADAVILTIPDDDATMRACRAIREIAPGVFIAVRTTYLSRAIQATELGADHVTVEEVVTAQDMAKQVLARLAQRARQPVPVAPA